MHIALEKVLSILEIENLLSGKPDNYFFTENELESAKQKNRKKSLNARYLIKKTILDYLDLKNDYMDIEIENDISGKPIIRFKGKVNKQIKNKQIINIQISISHSKNYIATLVTIE